MNQYTKTVKSLLPIVFAATGFLCSLTTLCVCIRWPAVKTTVDASHFYSIMDGYPATGLALILSSLAVITAPKWKWTFWICVAGFGLAFVITVTTSADYFFAAIFCCVVLILAKKGVPKSVYSQAVLMFVGFYAGVFILNNFQAATRSKFSRTQNDLRNIVFDLESYRVDYNAFPASTTDPSQRVLWKSDSAMPSFVRYQVGGPYSLTTPVAYISELPIDPLRYLSEKRTYAYYCAPNGQKCVLIGAGPNCVFDLRPEDLDELTSNPLKFVNYWYDPTNGTLSAGDIFRVGPR